jgi:hypothetical protein
VKFRATRRTGYNMLKGWNLHKYPGWHWTINQKANATQVDQKHDGETTSIFKIKFSQDRTGPMCPTSVYVPHDDDDDDDDDDISTNALFLLPEPSKRNVW